MRDDEGVFDVRAGKDRDVFVFDVDGHCVARNVATVIEMLNFDEGIKCAQADGREKLAMLCGFEMRTRFTRRGKFCAQFSRECGKFDACDEVFYDRVSLLVLLSDYLSHRTSRGANGNIRRSQGWEPPSPWHTAVTPSRRHTRDCSRVLPY